MPLRFGQVSEVINGTGGDKEVVGEAIDVGEDRFRDVAMLVDGDDESLSAAGDAASDVQLSSRGVSSWKDKIAQLR